MRRALRSFTVGAAVVGAVLAGTAPASAEPAFTSQFIRTNYLSVTPFPLGYEDLQVATNGTGVVRFTAGELCNLLAPRCAGYSSYLSVRWVNFSNGSSGAISVGAGDIFVTTGRGAIGVSVTAEGTLGVPAFGSVNA